MKGRCRFGNHACMNDSSTVASFGHGVRQNFQSALHGTAPIRYGIFMAPPAFTAARVPPASAPHSQKGCVGLAAKWANCAAQHLWLLLSLRDLPVTRL